jgi:hypothetical protein
MVTLSLLIKTGQNNFNCKVNKLFVTQFVFINYDWVRRLQLAFRSPVPFGGAELFIPREL